MKRFTYYGSLQSYRFLLDEVPNASRGNSVFKLKSSYTGNCLRVNTANQNIGFDSNNLLDTSAITQATDFVDTWYDQESIGNSIQNGAGARPRIKNSNVIDTLNGVPALYFDGTNDRLIGGGTLFVNKTQGFIAMVVNRDANNALQATPFSVATGTNITRANIQYRSPALANQGISAGGRRLNANSFQGVGASTYTANQIIVCAYFDWGNARLRLWENGVLTGDLNPFQTAGATPNDGGSYSIGSFATGATELLNGNIQECVVWEDAAAVNAANNVNTIFSNINSRFNTY
jgi:hypothetical protein